MTQLEMCKDRENVDIQKDRTEPMIFVPIILHNPDDVIQRKLILGRIHIMIVIANQYHKKLL